MCDPPWGWPDTVTFAILFLFLAYMVKKISEGYKS
jgi:hypothetical protein